MPNNLYGPGDNYHLENSHVLAAMIRDIEAKRKKLPKVTCWGTGSPFREFLYSEDGMLAYLLWKLGSLK